MLFIVLVIVLLFWVAVGFCWCFFCLWGVFGLFGVFVFSFCFCDKLVIFIVVCLGFFYFLFCFLTATIEQSRNELQGPGSPEDLG